MFGIKPEPVPEEETDRIERLYKEWERRILWPKNNKESHDHDKLCAKKCVCRIKQQEIHEWEDFALTFMDKTLEELGWN